MAITYFLFDIVLILLLARLVGGLAVKLGQPRVVGEIASGVLLGPTLLGDELSLLLAPAEVRPALLSVATMALALFMFLAGIEFDLEKVRGRGMQAGLLAVLGVLIPGLVAIPIAGILFTPAYAGPGAGEVLPFALFIGASLSVTAFPVMAAILMARRQLKTSIGSVAVASTGIMTVLMFGYLAFSTAIATSTGMEDFLVRGAMIVVFITVSLWAVRPLLRHLLPDESLGGDRLALVFGGLVLYALISHYLGINAMIGGFIWGMILPANMVLRANLSGKVKDITLVLLLPIFFAMAGFEADLRLLDAGTLPAIGLLLVGAIGSKFLAALPVVAFGESLRVAGFLGALYNTRGLLVLVCGLIGLEFEIITGLTFTIFMVVALVTNFMTVPLLNLFSLDDVEVDVDEPIDG
jgi:Kef-type K+ transport system membrane component KefB